MIKGILQINAWRVLTDAIERGIAYGLTRAYKHTETPSKEILTEAILTAIQNELGEVMYESRATVEETP